MSAKTSHHLPILLDPITDFLCEGIQKLPADAEAGLILDCTLGGGGHAMKILEKLQQMKRCVKVTLLGFDRDPEAISRNQIKFEKEIQEGRIELIHAPFSKALQYVKNRPVYGVLADLGVSSDQIDSESRGFSFRYPAPLDMRMNPQTDKSLADLLASISETELADWLWKYGDERFSRKIAKKLISLRDNNAFPQNTLELAEAIASVFPPPLRYKKIHAATRSFQALRIAVNRELEELETLLRDILPQIAPRGRIAVLAFHSLEDRLVKETLRNGELFSLPSRKAIQASEAEVTENSRSRSAKLRFAIRNGAN